MGKKERKFDYDLVVIGSGAAGAVVAESVASGGKKVAIIESGSFGGYAPNFGDIPLRAALESAHLFAKTKTAGTFGLRTNSVGYGFPGVKNWRESAILRSGVKKTAEYLRSRGVDVVRGRAHFISKNEITVGRNSNRRHISSDKFVVATGISRKIPKIFDEISVLTPENIFDLNRPPKTLAVIGSGAEAVELAEFFAILGTKVYMIEKKAEILGGFDEEVSNEVREDFSKSYETEFLVSAEIFSVKKEGSLAKITYSAGGSEKSIKVEEVLFAESGSPCMDLGLVSAGAEFDEYGILTDDFLSTSAKNIFAAGNVAKRNFLNHVDISTIIYQASVASQNLFKRKKESAFSRPDYKTLAINPKVVSVGLSEITLRENDIKYKKSVVQNNISSQANISGEARGFVKILASQKGEILGATIMGAGALEEIGVFSLAIRHGLTAEILADEIQPFGSWNETVQTALRQL